MRTDLLVLALTRQFAGLIARLATLDILPPDLSALRPHQLVHDVAAHLDAAGVDRRVIAQVFAVTPRSVQLWLRETDEAGAATDPPANRPLGLRIVEFMLAEHRAGRPRALQTAIESEIAATAARVTEVLATLVGDGLLYRTGRAGSTAFGVVDPEALEARRRALDTEYVADAAVMRALTHHDPATERQLASAAALDAEQTRAALARLRGRGRAVAIDGRWRRSSTGGYAVGDARRAEARRLPPEWRVAVLDHFDSAVSALIARLTALGGDDDAPDEPSAVSTYVFEVRPATAGRAVDARVRRLLDDFRIRASGLRDALDAANLAEGAPPEGFERLVLHIGQSCHRPDAPGRPPT